MKGAHKKGYFVGECPMRLVDRGVGSMPQVDRPPFGSMPQASVEGTCEMIRVKVTVAALEGGGR